MADIEKFDVELIEKELINVDLIEKELIGIELLQVDLIPRKSYVGEIEDIEIDNEQDKQVLVLNVVNNLWENKYLTELLQEYTIIEYPTKINSKRFQTSNNFISGTLEVYLNGLKEKEISIINSNTFEFKIDTITTDVIEVKYVKQP